MVKLAVNKVKIRSSLVKTQDDMIIKTIIIDDDFVARRLLENYCSKAKFIEIIAIYESALDALKGNMLSKADLIFLDMEMPGMSGIEFLNQLSTAPQVIFTTSQEKYALKAFDYQALDFLKKPFNFLRFKQAVLKAHEEIAISATPLTTTTNRNFSNQNSIFLKEDGRWIRVQLDDIYYFENEGDYVKVKTINKQYLIYKTMKSIEQSLQSDQFLRIHRSFIVNLNKIIDIQDSSLVIDRAVVPISKTHKSTLMHSLRTL